MKKNFLLAIMTSAFLILLFPFSMQAQAWTKAKGVGFYKMDFSSVYASYLFDNQGEVVSFRTLGNYTTSFYGEYGVTDKFTVVGYVPFLIRNVFSETQDAQGNITAPAVAHNAFGDVDLGLRYALPFEKVAVSANLLLGIPTGDSEQADALLTGDGEFNQMLKIGVGTGGKRWWTQGALGVNNRTQNFSDEFRYDLEFGYKFLNDRLLAMLKINGVESFNNGSVQATATGLFSNDVEFMGIGIEILHYVNKNKTFGVTARAAGAAKGRNVLAAPALSLGVFAEL